jgi:signal transduction histidine kinase
MMEMNILAHEIINPLNIIVGCAELSRIEIDQLKNNKISSYLNTIVSESMKCCHLLEKQIKQQNENMSFRKMDFIEMITHIISGFNEHPLIVSNNKKIIFNKNNPEHYNIDIMNENICYLKIVLNNMIMNSIKHSNSNNKTDIIDITMTQLPNNKLEVIIKNNILTTAISSNIKDTINDPKMKDDYYFVKSNFLGLNIIDSLVNKLNATWNMIQDNNTIITSLII